MNLVDYVQINLPKKYQRNGYVIFQYHKVYCINLLSRLKPNPCSIINNIAWYYWYQSELLLWEKWVNENVFSDKNLCDTNEKTNMVLLRIATGMINKLSCITEDEKKLLHNTLLEFYMERKRVYMDYHYREVLGLPF